MSTNTNNPSWTTASVYTFPIVEAADGQHFTTGSLAAHGVDDDQTEAGLRVNDLFVARPELVLGTIGMVRKNDKL